MILPRHLKSAPTLSQKVKNFSVLHQSLNFFTTGKWGKNPSPNLNPKEEDIVSLRSVGFKGSVKIDLAYQVVGDNRRSYIISVNNPYGPAPKDTISCKVATSLTTTPQQVAFEAKNLSQNGGLSTAVVRFHDIKSTQIKQFI